MKLNVTRRFVQTTVAVVFLFIGCKKSNEEATRWKQYKDVVYRIQTTDSSLQVVYRKAVYTDSVKGNIDQDTIFTAPGLYQISATVLTGVETMLYGESHSGPNFHLEIQDEDGNILVQTEKVTYYPANEVQLHDMWVSRLKTILSAQ